MNALPSTLSLVILYSLVSPLASRPASATGACWQAVVPVVLGAGDDDGDDEHEDDDDDDHDEKDEFEDDDEEGWDDDVRLGRGGSVEHARNAVNRVDGELAELRRIRAELDRQIADHRKQLQAAPKAIDPAVEKAQLLKREAEQAKAGVAAAQDKALQAQRDAARLLRRLKEESRQQSEADELLQCELIASEQELAAIVADVRVAMERQPAYRQATEFAKSAGIRLEYVKEEQKAGRARPGDLVDAINLANQAKANVEQIETARLAQSLHFIEARNRLIEVRQRIARHESVRESIAKADPAMLDARARVEASRTEQRDATVQVSVLSKAQGDAAEKVSRMKRQLKSFAGDLDRMLAARAAIDTRIQSDLRLKGELDGRIAGR